MDNPDQASRSVSMSFDSFRERPIDGGKAVSLAEAEVSLNAVLYLPQDARARRETIDRVWVSDPALVLKWSQAAITFESGLVIVEERPQFPDARAEFEGLVAESLPGIDARVAEVGGIPALVIEPKSDAVGANPGSVQIVVGDASPGLIDGTSVTIYGEDVSGAELMQVLATLVNS